MAPRVRVVAEGSRPSKRARRDEPMATPIRRIRPGPPIGARPSAASRRSSSSKARHQSLAWASSSSSSSLERAITRTPRTIRWRRARRRALCCARCVLLWQSSQQASAHPPPPPPQPPPRRRTRRTTAKMKTRTEWVRKFVSRRTYSETVQDVHTVDSTRRTYSRRTYRDNLMSRAVQDAPVYNVQQKQSSKKTNPSRTVAYKHGLFHARLDEHEKSLALYATVLDGLVESG